MKIVIVGAGKVGSILCQDLSREGHSVTLIEKKESLLESMLEKHEILGVRGNGSYYDVQIEAGVDSADMFIAATPHDETNIISAVIAKRIGAKYTMARVRTPEHAAHMGFVKDSLGIDSMINPDLDAAKEISRLIRYPSALSVQPFAGNRVNLVELVVTKESILNKQSLIDFRKRYNHLLVCIVVRDNQTIIPRGETVLMEGDHIFLTGKPQELGLLYRHMGTLDRIRSLLIIGGGRICTYVLDLLKEWGINIKVIEQDKEVALQLAVNYPDVTVIHGDGTDQNLLSAENIHRYDCVLTLTGIDEENILLSLFAQSCGVLRLITKVNRTNLLQILREAINQQSIITPAGITADYIVHLARAISNSEGSKVEALYRMQNSDAQALQFFVEQKCLLIGKPLKALKIRKNTIISAIVRNQQVLVPTGNDALMAGDHVVVITLEENIFDLDEIVQQ